VRFCPVCFRKVRPTTWGTVAGHMDSINRSRCPMSEEPYESCYEGTEFLRRFAA
jgi:hypothetical protein